MTTLAAARPHPGSDFPDWLSPILVKELRQGLKSRVFVGAFLALQFALIVVLGLQLLSETYGMNSVRRERVIYDLLYWLIVAAPLLVVMPARGLTAVSAEANAQTLDLVQLTRLTATRIVFGKWLSLVSQSLLLVATVVPYAMIRYYFGQIDILLELKVLFILLESSLLLTALAVTLSTLSLIPRVIALIAVAPGLLWCIVATMAILLAEISDYSLSGPMSSSFLPHLHLLATVMLCIAYLLEMAAGRIAPITENHSGRRRAIALAAALLSLLFGGLEHGQDAPATIVLLPLLGWAVVEAICERTPMEPGAYRSLARRGSAGRLCGRMFYPGWAPGLFFAAAIVLLTSVGVAEFPTRAMDEHRELTSLLFLASLVLPVAAWPRIPRRFPLFGAWLLAQVVFFLFWAIVSEIPGETGDFLTILLPLSALAEVFSYRSSVILSSDLEFIAILGICIPVLVLTACLAAREFRMIRRLEREAVGEAEREVAA